MFVNLAITSLGNSAFSELEASLFCLGSLAECVPDESDYDSIMGRIFGSQMFDILASLPVGCEQY
jgi:hypothetical protein